MIQKKRSKLLNQTLQRVDNIKYILKLVFKLKKSYFIICLFLCIVNAIIPYIIMLNTQNIINGLQVKKSLEGLMIELIMFIILGIISITFTNLNSYYTSKYNEYLYYELNKELLYKSKKFDLQDFENPNLYDMIQRAEQEIGIRPFNIVISLFSMVGQTINIISAFLILISWHWWIVCGFLILPIFATKYFSVISNNEYNVLMNRTKYERKSWYITHLLTKDEYIKEVKLFDLSEYLLKLFDILRKRFFLENVSLYRKKVLFLQIYQLFNYMLSFFIVCMAIYESSLGLILVGTVITYINTTSKIETAIQGFVNTVFSLYRDALYITNIKKYFEFENNRENNTTKIEEITSIEFKNVSFKYPNRNIFALRKISFKVNRGEVLAIVGENGSGKTTIIKLINGMYDNYEGNILINNLEIKLIDKKSLRKCLATLFQDYNKYQFTIKDNIGFGSIKDADNIDRIKASSKKANANEFIDKLPNQYEQQVGYWFEGGTQLSGGQWQKLGIARMFMKNSDCFILDEPTASLDPFSEYEIFKQIQENIYTKICIFITHRFINVSIVNTILVLRNGEIIERGSHQELLDKNGFYKNMFDIQNKKIHL